MKKPTHEEVSQRARQIWEEKGRPVGRDDETWLDAERQLTHAAESDSHSGAHAGSSATAKAGEHATGHHTPAPTPGGEAAMAALQKQEARLPISPHTSAPKTKPTESGKPLWNQPHSS